MSFPPFFWSTCRYTSLRVSTNWSWWGEICKKYCWLKCWLGLIKRNLLDVTKIMLTKCWLRLICKSTHLIHLSNRPTHLQNLSFANFDELEPWWCAVILINIGKQPRKKRFDIKGILEGARGKRSESVEEVTGPRSNNLMGGRKDANYVPSLIQL